ncbi:type VI secretion system contractile sheath small subunit [Sulfitobacter sp.]|uniref:type VI secretion system contractile sheath small subunit n=1 Tax=Sulfitobacter sp. TaxID=1903071 RepID=UPI003F6AE43F
MSSSQKFIARNRAPRVQIEYDVELYGAEKKVQLPFVMGVMSDLSGKSATPPVADRKFLEIDVDNFNDRMAAIAPKAQFSVPNTLTGDGNLAVDLTFTKMGDFTPEAIAENVDALRPLLEARRRLSDLMTYMDGKSGAETLIEKLLSEPALLGAVSGSSEAGADVDAALDSLRAALPADTAQKDSTDAALASLAAQAPVEQAEDTSVSDVLGSLQPPPETEEIDEQASALDALRAAPVIEQAETETADAVLSGISRSETVDTPPSNEAGAVLSGMVRVEEVASDDTSGDVLAGINRIEDTPETDDVADILGSLNEAPEQTADTDTRDDILGGIADVAPVQETDITSDVLAGLADTTTPLAADQDATSDILAGLERQEDTVAADDTNDILASLDAPAEEKTDDVADVLASIEAAPADMGDDVVATNDILASIDAVPANADQDGESLDDILGDIAANPVVDAPDDTSADDILAGMEAPEPAVEETNSFDNVLGDMADAHVDAENDDDAADDVLANLDAPTPATAAEENIDDILGDIADVEAAPEEDSSDAILESLDAPTAELAEDTELDDVLAGLDTPEVAEASDDLDDILGGLDSAEEASEESSLDDILGDLDTLEVAEAADDLDDILGGLDVAEEASDESSLDDILGDLDAPEVADAADDLDKILGGLDAAEEASDESSLDDILGDLDTPEVAEAADDLDDILGGLDVAEEPAAVDELDDLLAGLGDDTPEGDTPAKETDDLDALLGGLDEGSDQGGDGLDDMLAGLDTPASANVVESKEEKHVVSHESRQSPFGLISEPRPERASLNRKKFRMAVFGDFTGRAAKGQMETGDALAARAPIALDVDTIDEIIEGFGTTLNLKIGKDGSGVEVKLKEFDDLHPDELYDNLGIFDEISGLRKQLAVGSMADRTIAQLKTWSETHATPIKLPKRSASTSVPVNLKLSDFQALIGDTGGSLTPSGPADDLIAQVVGPHIVKAPDAGAAEMTKAVDEALSSAMRLVLHHPDFQAIEAQWRSLDMLARRIETDSTLEIILYDVSAEELAADLAAQEDLSQSGLFKLVTDVLDPEEGAGGFSALFGLYTFEETPPHAELLARIGQIGAHVDAPFFSAITPNYLETAKEDRHPLVAETWDTLRGLPEAAYIALSSPRFLLRLPYGAKSEPIYPFSFEEFTPKEGLKGMLWANPVVLVAILLAGTHKKDGKAMDLGSLMSLGDLPFHYVTDRYGDQVALPCTERNLTSDAAQMTLGRGFMPVVWVKGRNEIRLGSFRSLAGDMIAGPWEAEVPAQRPKPGGGTLNLNVNIPVEQNDGEAGADDTSLDDLLSGTETDDISQGDGGDDTSLDDLLAGFDDDGAGDDGDDMDPDLAALLEGL